MNSFTLTAGFAEDFPIQVRLKGSGHAAKFAVDDVLAGAFYPYGNPASACTPTITFYSAGVTQTGYDQGQVVASFSTANSLVVVPSIPYVLVVSRARSATPTVFTPVAIVRFDVAAPSAPR
jgi:hypothetical protein